jgi:hypothetical protein
MGRRSRLYRFGRRWRRRGRSPGHPLLFLYFRFMMPNRATDCSARHCMMTRQVTGYATNRRAFNTAMRACDDRQHSGADGKDNHHYFPHTRSLRYRDCATRRHRKDAEREQIRCDGYQDRPTVNNGSFSANQMNVHTISPVSYNHKTRQ